jgi:tetratricopeptide (TPR) repeat protein
MSQVVLPQNVQQFVRTEAGSHLMLLMLENTLGSSLHRISPLERTQFEQEYGTELPIELDLELLLTHLSRIRVVADLNSHAEDCLVNYWATEDGTIFLTDARRYVVDGLRIAPREHPERGRAYKILAYLLFARNKPKEAIQHIEKALAIFKLNDQTEPIEELLEIMSSRSEPECKLVQENIAAVLRKMEVELSWRSSR